MIFTTYWFALFAVAFFALFWAAVHPTLRLGVLILACGFFHYHFAGPAGVVPIVVLSTLTYLAGLSRRPAVHYAVVAVLIGSLALYKYAHFAILGGVAPLLPKLAPVLDRWASRAVPSAPPLAVSFFTFEFAHYLIDVSRGARPIRHPLHFYVFGFFFPSLVAGPIKRYEQFLPSLRSGLAAVDLPQVKRGVVRLAVGYFKKAVLADNLTAALAYWEPHFGTLAIPSRWLFVGGLSLRILLDFSGYTDIAIGLAQMMGVRLPENFNWPYLTTNLSEFWRSWHISLSSWLRDYVYIPLGGNRRGELRRSLNLVATFALCGLWHGASGHFLGWGLYHGAGLVIAGNYHRLPGGLGQACRGGLRRLPGAAWLLTLLYVSLGWLLFFYPLDQALGMLRLLFHP